MKKKNEMWFIFLCDSLECEGDSLHLQPSHEPLGDGAGLRVHRELAQGVRPPGLCHLSDEAEGTHGQRPGPSGQQGRHPGQSGLYIYIYCGFISIR